MSRIANSLASLRPGANLHGGQTSLSNLPPLLTMEVWECDSMRILLKIVPWDFPGGTVFKSPPANAGDTGSSPGPGRSHVLRSN